MSLKTSLRLTSIFAPLPRSARFAQAQTAICPACLRRLQRREGLRAHHSRGFATAAAERPSSLRYEPPPRNAAVPNTSITSGATEADVREREAQRAGRPPAPPPHTTEGSSSLREGPAQASHPAPQAEETAAHKSSTISKPPRKSKLRPRKAAMSLTPKAVSQLQELLQQPDPKMIRIGVKNRGCSGLAYHLEYVDKPSTFDEAVEQEGVKVLIDSKALFSIIGSEMDWQEDKLSARFVFRNPNISEFGLLSTLSP